MHSFRPLNAYKQDHTNEMHTGRSQTHSSQGSRCCCLLRNWWLSAGCVLCPPTTSITLRQKQGGERCALLMLSVIVVTVEGQRGSRVSKFETLTSYSLHAVFLIYVPKNCFCKSLSVFYMTLILIATLIMLAA